MLTTQFSLIVFIAFLGALPLAGAAVYAFAEHKNKLRQKAEMEKTASIDPVTGRINYTKFKAIVQELFAENPTKKYAIFYSDIKNFKYINDVYGFEAGNQVLHRVSDLLCDSGKIAFARINADNFVSVEEYDDTDLLLKKCRERIAAVSDISSIVDDMPAITVFAGVYCSNGDNTSLSLEGMIDRANIAQRKVKETHLSGCLLFAESFRTTMLAEQEMENNMHTALKNGEFIIYLQPKIDIDTGKIAAAEALVRWNSPSAGLLTPAKFIPLFERNGFIQKLDTYVFEQVCKLIRKWLDAGNDIVPISANVSKMQLNNPAFLKEYNALKQRYDIPNGLVEIEFTESMLFDNSERMISVLKFFEEHGFLSSIDDFGSGYSSLNLLKTLPTDFLKLDKVFFDNGEYKSRERVIIKNVILMAKELSMQTIAEGVEQWDQVEFLKSVECEMVQGYVFDRPMPIADFEKKYITVNETSCA
ncbi:MAG: GGDEF domain-containing phosphodiesterase [Angelakisella sp.]